MARPAAWIFLFLLFVHLAATRGHFTITDEVIAFETTRSLAERFQLDIPSAGLSATYEGKDQRSYGLYSIGDSVAAIPFYLAGRTVDRFCRSRKLDSWNRTFAGPVIGGFPEWLWGGSTEIFFVSLFNAFVVAALGVLFFLFQLRLGCSRRWAAVGALAVGLSSQIAGLSSSFFEHPSEGLLLLGAFYALVAERQTPGPALRIVAGSLAGLLILVRLQAGVALPALTIYLAFNVARRSSSATIPGRLRALARPALDFAFPIATAIFINCWIHFLESGRWSLLGGYGTRPSPFTGPLYRALFGYFLSPGQSIFLFTPLLLLLRPTFRQFRRRFPRETLVIGGAFASYVLVFGELQYWHGLWCYGPRYLAATIPLLLLPLPLWLETGPVRRRLAAAALALAGVWLQATSLLVNFSFVFHAEHYIDATPWDSFLFQPINSPILAHSRALLNWNHCVDFWLLNVWRDAGAGRMWGLLLPLVAAAVLAAGGLCRSLREPGIQGPNVIR